MDTPHTDPIAESSFERTAALAGLSVRVLANDFRRGHINALLAGVKVDLREATLGPEGGTLFVQSVLSGIEVLVPPSWEVVCEIEPFLGGVDAGRARPVLAEHAGVLRVKGTVVAGGLTVR